MSKEIRLALIAPCMNDANSYKHKDRRVLPLGVYALETYLKQFFDQVFVIDAVTYEYSNEDICNLLNQYRCNIIGISGMTNKYYESVIELAQKIKANCSADYIFVGGPLATFCADILLKDPNIDFVVRGEGEYILKNIMDYLSSDKDIFKLKGLAYRENGEIVFNELEQRIKDFTHIPFPKYNFDKKTIAEFISGSRSYVIMASRGCMGQCYFCQVPYYYGRKGIYWRDPKSVVDEIAYAIEQWGVRRFNFQDSNFLLNQKWLNEFIGLIHERNLSFLFNIFANTESIEEDIIVKLKKIGLFQVFVGFETGSEKRHKQLKKNALFYQNDSSIDILQRNKIKLIPGFILYYPDSTIDEIEESVNWFRKHGLIKPSMYFNKMDLWYGSPEYERLKEKGKIVSHSISSGMQYDFEDNKVSELYKLMIKGSERVKPLWSKITDQNLTIRQTIDEVVYCNLSDDQSSYKKIKKVVDDYINEMKQLDNGRISHNDRILNKIISLYFDKVLFSVKQGTTVDSDEIENYLESLISTNEGLFQWINIELLRDELNERF